MDEIQRLMNGTIQNVRPTSLDINWEPSNNPPPALTVISHALSPSQIYQPLPQPWTRPYHHVNLKPGTAHNYRIVEFDSFGNASTPLDLTGRTADVLRPSQSIPTPGVWDEWDPTSIAEAVYVPSIPPTASQIKAVPGNEGSFQAYRFTPPNATWGIKKITVHVFGSKTKMSLGMLTLEATVGNPSQSLGAPRNVELPYSPYNSSTQGQGWATEEVFIHPTATWSPAQISDLQVKLQAPIGADGKIRVGVLYIETFDR
jgi:hypothetical protein